MSLLDKKAGVHENASTQINVPEDVAEQIIRIGQELIPDEHLAGEGRVTQPHITVKYGVRPDQNLLQQALAGQTAFPVTLGNTTVFSNSDGAGDNAGGIPVVIEVHGERLQALHDVVKAAMGLLPDEFAYEPHITIAYVKQEESQHYAGRDAFVGIEFVAEAVALLPYDDSKQVEVPLAKAAAQKFYHASSEKFKPGTVLKPSGHPSMFTEREEYLEQRRPESSLSRMKSVFMGATPKDVKLWGDNVYEVVPIGNVERNSWGWFEELVYLDDPEALDEEYDLSIPEEEKRFNEINEAMEAAARNYWAGVKDKAPGDFWEYRAPAAKVVGVVKTASEDADYESMNPGWREEQVEKEREEFDKQRDYMDSLGWMGKNPWYPERYPSYSMRIFPGRWAFYKLDMAKNREEKIAEGRTLEEMKKYLSKYNLAKLRTGYREPEEEQFSNKDKELLKSMGIKARKAATGTKKIAASPAQVTPEISQVTPQIPQQQEEEQPEEEKVQRDEPATVQPQRQKKQPKNKLLKKQPKPKPYKAPKPPAQNPNFKKWFGKSKVVDLNDEPIVVYHGTTHDFQAFDPSTANVENYYGKALYFTSSKEDLAENYATESGPDLTVRIDNQTDRLMQDWDQSWDDIKDDIIARIKSEGWNIEDLEEFPNWSNVPGSAYQILYEAARREVRSEIAGTSQGMTMPVYLSIQNPVYVQKHGGTEFELNIDEEGNESGSGLDLYNAMNRAAASYYTADAQEVWNDLIDNHGESFNAWDFEKQVRDGGHSFEDDEGNQAAGNYIADVYQEMGFDGIIQDAYEAFGVGGRGRGMRMSEDTKHFIIWDPTKVKSALGNTGKYDPKNPSITASKSAAPLYDSAKTRKFYHGTDKEELAEKIMAEGIQPRSITMPDKAKSRSQLAPVADRVYLTDSFGYAAIYAVGGSVFGSKHMEFLKGKDPFGYVFEIDGSALTGDMVPDEDSIGEWMSFLIGYLDDKRKFEDWTARIQAGKPLNEYEKGQYERYKKEGIPYHDQAINKPGKDAENARSHFMWMYSNFLTEKQKWAMLHNPDIGILATVGKKLQKRITPEVLQFMLDNGAHAAHQGAVYPTKAWKIDKAKAVSIGGSQSNWATEVPIAKTAADWDDEEFNDEPQQWEQMFTLQPGTVLYHGTSTEWEEGDNLNFPAWFSTNRNVANWFAHRNDEGTPVIRIYRVTKPIELVELVDKNAMQEFFEMYGIEDYGIETISEGTINAGFEGWIIPDNYRPGDDIMLGNGDGLEFMGVEPAGAKTGSLEAHIFAAGEKSVGDLGLAKRIMHELMPILGVQLPEPEIKIVNSPRSGFLGQDVWRVGTTNNQIWGGDNTTIHLQRSILKDEDTLRRILAHELAHHADNLINGPKLIEKYQSTWGGGKAGYNKFFTELHREGHGKGWKEFARKFDAKYGKDFVTEKSDERDVVEELPIKPYYIALYKHPSGKIYFASASRLGPKALRHLWYKRIHPDESERLTTTDDRLFVRGAAIGQGWSIPNKENAEVMQAKLEELWNKAENEKPIELPNPWVKETKGGPVPDASIITKYLEKDGKEVMVKPSEDKSFSGWVDVWSRYKTAAIKTLPPSPEWRERLEPQIQERLKQKPYLAPVREKLLSLGGWEANVDYSETPADAQRLLDKGQFWKGSGSKMRKGLPNRCHGNAACLMREGVGTVATGYALSKDGLWRQHSWIVTPEGSVIETTVPRKGYFGVLLTQQEVDDEIGIYASKVAAEEKTASKRDEAVTSMTIGTDDPDFPSPVLIRYEQGMRWRQVLKAVKAIVGEIAGHRVAWNDIHIWASLWENREEQDTGWEAEKARGQRVMYDVLHNGSFVSVGAGTSTMVGAEPEARELYHGTPIDNIEDIKQNGIQLGNDDGVWLAKRPADAANFAKIHLPVELQGNPEAQVAVVVLDSSKIPTLEPGMEAQPYDWSSEAVPPQAIKRIDTYDTTGHKVADSHKVTPLEDTYYNNPEIGQETNAYADIPERVRGQYDVPGLKELAPQLFEKESSEYPSVVDSTWLLRYIDKLNYDTFEDRHRIFNYNKWKKITVPLDKLVPDLAFRKSDVESYTAEKGPYPPIVLDVHGDIIDGHHRTEAAKLRGDKTIDAYVPVFTSGGVDYPHRFEKSGADSPLKRALLLCRPNIARKAQAIYDAWEQNEEGVDEEYAGGGICDAIAEEIMDVVSNVIFEVGGKVTEGGQPGDDHAWVIAYNDKEAYGVDIPHGVYERGGGYSWTKVPGVTFSAEDVEVFPVDVDPAEFAKEGAAAVEGVDYRVEVHDAPKGGLDTRAEAWLDGKCIGWVNFFVADMDTELSDTRYWKEVQDEYGAKEWERIAEIPKQAWIRMVYVDPKYRRMGVATGMYQKIKEEFPGITFTSSGTTGEGTKFRSKLKERGVISALLKKAARPNFPPTFRAYVKNRGGVWKYIDQMGDAWSHYAEWISMEDPSFDALPENQQNKRLIDFAVRDMEQRYEYRARMYNNMTFPVDVYREITVDNPKDLKTKGIGVFWAWSEEKAEAHWGQGGDKMLLHAQLTSPNQINWDMTMLVNLDPSIGEAEDECRLKDGTKIKLVDIESGAGEEVPLQLPAMVTAKKIAAAEDLSNLVSYLTMSPRENGEELARSFPPLFVEYLEENDLYDKYAKLIDEDGYIDNYGSIPDQVLTGFLDEKGSRAQEYDPAYAPTFLTVEYKGMVKNQWLIHFTDHPDAIAKEGFRYGMDRIDNLALTTYFKDEAKKFGGYNFALRADHRNLEGLGKNYGKHCVLFRADGVRTYHYGDEFEQIIFWGKDAKDIIPIYSNYDMWYIPNAEGDPLIESYDIHEVINWAIANYRKLIRKPRARAAALLQKNAVYGEAQNQVQHSDHQAIGLTKTLKSDPFATELETLAETHGQEPPPANPGLPDQRGEVRQPPAKGEDQFHNNQAQKMTQAAAAISFSGLPENRPEIIPPQRPITETPAFKAWFGASKVVDSDGKPMMAFHATKQDFSTFKTEPRKETLYAHSAMDTIGAWFTTSSKLLDEAHAYFMRRVGPAPRTMPVYLSIKNPLWVKERKDLEGRLDELVQYVDPKMYARWQNAMHEGRKLPALNYAKGWRKALITMHYDGIVIENDMYGKAWVALYPNQIKSAIGNTGEFDPKNPDIIASDKTADFDYDAHEQHATSQDEVAYSVLDEYVKHYDDPTYRQQWRVVPAARLKKIWQDYGKMGFVRDEKGLDQIADIVIENIHKMEVNNILSGHTPYDPEEWAESYLGYKLPDDYFNKDDSFMDDGKGQYRISDYAADKLTGLAMQLRKADTAEKKLFVIDQILNVVHQRSDIAAWFVQGGSATLSQISETDPKPENVKKMLPKRRNPLLQAKQAAVKFLPFETWVKKHPEFDVFDVDVYTGKPLPPEDEDATTYEELDERYLENTQWLSSLDFPFEIYRALEVEKGSPVNLEKAGVHWSWVENSADAYFGGSSLWAKGSKPKNPEFVTLKALVTNANQIDFEKTLFNNMQNPQENEITLKPGAQVKLLGISRNGADYKKQRGMQTVTASAASALEEINDRFPVNPDNPKERMLLGYGNKPLVFFEIVELPAEITEKNLRAKPTLRLKSIKSLYPGEGAGSIALKRITAIADKHDAEIELTASPFTPFNDSDTYEMDTDALRAWYQRHEFENVHGKDPSYGYMTRKPKRASNTVSGEEVVDYVAKLNNWTTPAQRQYAYQLVGLDAGGDYILDEEYDLDKLEAGDDYSPATAQDYAEMKTPLPPIVLDIEGNIRDGNHRVAAAKLRGDKTIAAYVPIDTYEP